MSLLEIVKTRRKDIYRKLKRSELIKLVKYVQVF